MFRTTQAILHRGSFSIVLLPRRYSIHANFAAERLNVGRRRNRLGRGSRNRGGYRCFGKNQVEEDCIVTVLFGFFGGIIEATTPIFLPARSSIARLSRSASNRIRKRVLYPPGQFNVLFMLSAIQMRYDGFDRRQELQSSTNSLETLLP